MPQTIGQHPLPCGKWLRLLLSITILCAAGAPHLVSAGEVSWPEMLAHRSQWCQVVPVEDFCKGNFEIYYFDPQEGRCRTLHGCYDTLFESLAECRMLCEKEAREAPILPREVPAER